MYYIRDDSLSNFLSCVMAKAHFVIRHKCDSTVLESQLKDYRGIDILNTPLREVARMP